MDHFFLLKDSDEIVQVVDTQISRFKAKITVKRLSTQECFDVEASELELSNVTQLHIKSNPNTLKEILIRCINLRANKKELTAIKRKILNISYIRITNPSSRMSGFKDQVAEVSKVILK